MIKQLTVFLNKTGTIFEFIRYVFVGGFSFIVDFSTLFLFKEFILPQDLQYKIYIATALGFIAGIVVNYILSIIFVFTAAKDRQKGRDIKSFIIFGVIGIIGLILTELGMYIGVQIINVNYLIVKVAVTALVLIWNYTARKIVIFK